MTIDKSGRRRVMWPRSGPLHVQLYPSKAIESTSVMHSQFLLKLIEERSIQNNIRNVVAIADGVPDWSVKGMLNLLVFGDLWRKLKLDSLIIQCYAPGHSRFNPIERSWGHLTKWLVGVVLPVEVEEFNFVTPKPNETEKWDIILNNAVKECSKFWQNRSLEGYHVSIHPFFTDNEIIPVLKNRHKSIHEFVNSSKTKINSSDELLKMKLKYQFFVKHCNRKAYQLEFIRCNDVNCEHCQSLPNINNQFLEIIKKFGGTCPSPTSSVILKDHHYLSFEDMLRVNLSLETTKNKK